jgi:hypothetical protein
MAEEILIRINLQSGEAKSKIKEIKKATDDYAKSIDNLTKEQLEVLVAEQKVSIQRQITKKQVQELALAQINAANAANKNRAQSGLNNAILLETGRLASDASFGFTAIANNLSQVISLFQSFAKTNGGFIKSLEQLGRSLIGTGGLLIALQLIISFGPKIFKFFKELISGVDVLGEAFKNAGKTVESSAGNFEIYIDKLQDVNSSQKEQTDAIAKLKQEFPEFIRNLDDAGVSTEDLKNKTIDATTVTNDFRDALLDLALANAAREKIQELIGKQLQAEIDAIVELKKENISLEEAKRLSVKMDEINLRVGEKAIKGSRAFTKLKNEELNLLGKEGKERVLLSDEIIRNLDKEKLSFQDQINILMEYTKINFSTTESVGRSSQLRIQYQAGELDFQKEILKSQERTLNAFIKDEKTKLTLQNTNRIRLAQIRLEDFKEKEAAKIQARKDRLQARIDDVESELKSDKLTAEQRKTRLAQLKKFKQQKLVRIKQFEGQRDVAVRKAEKSLAKFIVQINKDTDKQLKVIDGKRDARNVQTIAKTELNLAKLADRASGLPKEFQTKEDEERKKQLNSQIAYQQGLVDTFEIGTEQRYNAELKLSQLILQLDDVTAQEREKKFKAFQKTFNDGYNALTGFSQAFGQAELQRVEAEYAQKIQAAGDNTEAQANLQAQLEKKRDKIARRQFRIQKAADIAKALIATFDSGIRAFGSQLIIGDPSSPARAQIAQAFAIASGLANVAKIASQKYQGSTGAGAGSGSGAQPPVKVEAPDFNVVGASQVSQLAQSVSGQVTKPVKAFVVGKEITSQQELDRNINNTAGI